MPWQRLSWILALAHRRPQSVYGVFDKLQFGGKRSYRCAPREAKACRTSLPSEKKKRTEIIIEIDELTVINSSQNISVRDWCPVCAGFVTFVPPELAAAIAGVAVRTINQWVEAESVHFLETNAGLLLVCVNSLK